MANRYLKHAITIPALVALTSCASLIEPDAHIKAEQVNVNKSYLDEPEKPLELEQIEAQDEERSNGKTERLTKLSDGKQNLTLEVDLSNSINNNQKFQVSVNALPLNDFVHYVFGELLDVSYLLEASVKNNKTPVTLNLKEEIPAKELFLLTQQILSQNNVNVVKNDNVFFLHTRTANSKTDKAFGFGRTESSVPNVSGEIIQLVPIRYDMNSGLRGVVNQLVDARSDYDRGQGMLTIIGQREQIIRALTLVNLLDSPTVFNKATALIGFDYINSETFITKVTEILKEEGITVAGTGPVSASVKFVPLEHLGKIAVFASSDSIIDRVSFWRDQLDKPAAGAEQSFYIYHPKFARASDLGQSLAPLLGGSLSGGGNRPTNNDASSSASTPSTNAANKANTVQSVNGDNIRLVVDERANALIFYSTGQYFQELQPIIRQLDIMPKQVMMEVVIAEVKLTGSFSKGVQYAIESGEATGRKESFSFNTEGEGAFNYSIVGLPGNISVNLSQTDGLVNVLSRPTLLVRDGVSANISVGDDIPTIGSTTTDPISGDRQTTQVEYRKTGVDLTVTPTINAQGTVIMTIQQNISNISPDSSGAGSNPSIFERTLSTEVVAGNGQTVMLGGLISENKSNGASSVPFFGDLPVLGHLFRTDSSSSDKTELVILVTPKIVQNAEDWQRVKDSFIKGLENIAF